jgi:hypothetical protein
MRIYNNDIFDILNFVLKKTNIKLKSYFFEKNYILNRWISMSHVNNAIIVNSTLNRWSRRKLNFNPIKFYRFILPKTTNNIKYIKKNQIKEEEKQDYMNLAKNLEISTREIKEYEEMLEILNTKNN